MNLGQLGYAEADIQIMYANLKSRLLPMAPCLKQLLHQAPIVLIPQVDAPDMSSDKPSPMGQILRQAVVGQVAKVLCQPASLKSR